MKHTIPLRATTATAARREAKHYALYESVQLLGYDADKLVYITSVRPQHIKAYVATASIPGRRASRFEIVTPGTPSDETAEQHSPSTK